MDGLIGFLVFLLVLALVVWLVIWVIDLLPLPDPPKMIAKVIVAVIALFMLLGHFLPRTGMMKPLW